MTERSYMHDFLGGVDPTGTKTFQYGMEDAAQGQTSGMRRAVGTAGGILGGAAVVPGAVGGLVGAIKGLAMGKGGLKGRLLSAGQHAVRGAKQPYSSLYRGMKARSALKAHQAGKALSSRQGGDLQKFVRQSLPEGVLPSGEMGSQRIQSALKQMAPSQMAKVRKHLGGELAAGAGALGLSGLVSGGSAYAQYGKGGVTGNELRNANVPLQKVSSVYARGFYDVLDRLL